MTSAGQVTARTHPQPLKGSRCPQAITWVLRHGLRAAAPL